jgi:hypothetical protein
VAVGFAEKTFILVLSSESGALCRVSVRSRNGTHSFERTATS